MDATLNYIEKRGEKRGEKRSQLSFDLLYIIYAVSPACPGSGSACKIWKKGKFIV